MSEKEAGIRTIIGGNFNARTEREGRSIMDGKKEMEKRGDNLKLERE